MRTAIGTVNHRAVLLNFNICSSDTLTNPGAAGASQSFQIIVKSTAINHDRFDLLGLKASNLPFGRMEANSAQFIQGNIFRNGEFPKNFRSNYARAVHRLARVPVFLKNVNLKAVARKASGSMQPYRAASYNNHIFQRTLQNDDLKADEASE